MFRRKYPAGILRKLIEDMYNLVMPPGEEIIHVLPQEFTVDNEPGIKDPIGMAGVRLEANFHIISGQVTAIKNIVKCVNKATSGEPGTDTGAAGII